MLDIKKVKQMLENGEEVRLECVDRSAFINDELNEKTRYNKRCITNFDPLVCSVSTTGIVMADGFYIDEDEFKYFRIAEDKPTFDDLIDIAVKAKKDGLLTRVEIRELSLNATSKDIEFCTSINAGSIVIQKRIDYIKSLYTETFVIESLADVERIKLKAKFSQNGFEYEIDQSKLNNLLDCKLFLLKGATVTQKRCA